MSKQAKPRRGQGERKMDFNTVNNLNILHILSTVRGEFKERPPFEPYDIEIMGRVQHPVTWVKKFLTSYNVGYFDPHNQLKGAAELKNGVFKYQSISGRSNLSVNLRTGRLTYIGPLRTEAWWPLKKGFAWRAKIPAPYDPPEERHDPLEECGGLTPNWWG